MATPFSPTAIQSPEPRPVKRRFGGSWTLFSVLTTVSVLLLVALGLAVLDWQTGDGVWSPWAIWPIGVVCLALALWTSGLLTTWGAHGLTVVLIVPELWLAQAIDSGGMWFPWVVTGWGVVVAAHGFVRFGFIGPIAAHLLATVVLASLVIGWDLTTDTVGWVRIAVFGLVLAWVTHVVIMSARRRGPKFATVRATSASGEVRDDHTDDQATSEPIRDAHAPTSLRRTSFGARLVTWLTLVIALGGVLLGLAGANAATSAGTWWVVWPAWGIIIVLSVTAGAMLSPRPLFAAHVGLAISVGLGLIMLNVWAGGPFWSAWVVFAFGLTLSLHGMIRLSLRHGPKLT